MTNSLKGKIEKQVITKTITSFKDPNNIVEKIVFTKQDAVYEMVIYKYKDRGVLCFSVQSGCRVGCTFCGTGRRFVRDLTWDEMVEQIEYGLKKIKNQEVIQIMSMSMGEPLDTNWRMVRGVAEKYLEKDYYFFISTVGLTNFRAINEMLELSKKYTRFGLQFSLHKTTDIDRLKLFRPNDFNYNFLTIQQMILIAELFQETSQFHNKVHFNYICTGNETEAEIKRLARIGKSGVITCSVLCNNKKFIKGKVVPAQRVANKLVGYGCDVKIFNPAGQDTIGGGCGQLLYVQKFLKEYKKEVV